MHPPNPATRRTAETNLTIAYGLVAIPTCHLVPAKVMATEATSDEVATVVSTLKSGLRKRAHD